MRKLNQHTKDLLVDLAMVAAVVLILLIALAPSVLS